MDMSGLQETCSTSQMRENYEEQDESSESELWEEDINPLGLLDLVYVEDEEETNEGPINDNQASSSISMNTNVQEEQEDESDTVSADSDEGEELEPFAAVDVLPGREEDFFPEGMTQEVMEPSRNPWTADRISNADPADHQWISRETGLEYGESILQRVLEVPGQIRPMGSHSTYPFTWKLALQENESENDVLESDQHSQPSFRETEQLSPDKARRHSYRQRYPELIRYRNREYARRYRQANAERVRERQRAYIKRYRERKKLEREQLERLAKRQEEAENITITDENGLSAILPSTRDKSKKEGVKQNMPPVMKTKNSEHVLDTNENDEIVLLT